MDALKFLGNEELPEKSEQGKAFVNSIESFILFILGLIAYISLYEDFNLMVTFALIMPIMIGGFKDMLLSTKKRERIIDALITMNASICFVLVILALKYV